MKNIEGLLGRQLNALFNKDFSNTEFSDEELNMVKSINISKRDLSYLELFNNLEELEIDSFPSVNNEDILYIGRKQPFLKKLKIKEQNALFLLNLSLFKNLEELCLIHNDNIIDISGLNRIKRFTFYDNKDYNNIRQIVDLLLKNKDSIITLDITYYINIVKVLFDMKVDIDILNGVSWIESIGLRRYNTYQYSNSEIDSLFKCISYISSKYVYSNDDDITKFSVLYTWMVNNIKFINEDDSEGENLSLISNVNKVFSYGRGGRLTLAKAFQLLLSFVGIKSSVVYSMGANEVIGYYNGEKVCSLLGESDYAVLRVTLDNKDYYCDIAWDTLINFHGFFEQLRFFLFSKTELKTRHRFVGEGNIVKTYSYHGDDCDEVIKKARERIKEVDEIFSDIERLDPKILGSEFNISLIKIDINDIKNELDNLEIGSQEYKNKMAEMIDLEDKIDNISNELIRFENSRDGIIKNYANLLLSRYLPGNDKLDKQNIIELLDKKKHMLLISEYIVELLKKCLK
ncbi:MAG: hypothetical protein ACI4XM_05040 [Candidatus Coprovivens sp.]